MPVIVVLTLLILVFTIVCSFYKMRREKEGAVPSVVEDMAFSVMMGTLLGFMFSKKWHEKEETIQGAKTFFGCMFFPCNCANFSVYHFN